MFRESRALAIGQVHSDALRSLRKASDAGQLVQSMLPFQLGTDRHNERPVTGDTIPIQVRLYADEVKDHPNSCGQHWSYLGVLIIPEAARSNVLKELQSDRKIVGYYQELKSTKLTQRPKIELARRWIRRVILDETKTYHFYILGLNLDNLQRETFGETRQEQNKRIYNRFFRSSVSYCLKSFFGSQIDIEVVAVFHDRELQMEADDLFDWHSIWRLSAEDDKVVFNSERINFIDSDHNKEQSHPEDSHFIQLIDLILGTVRQCLDFTSGKPGINEVALEILPLVQRLTDERTRRNRNSRFAHAGRCRLAFFPSKKLSLKDLEDPLKRAMSGFYYCRRPILADRLTGQQQLL